MFARNENAGSYRGLATSAAVATAMLLTGPAFADSGSTEIVSINANSFAVKSQNYVYTEPVNPWQALELNVNIKIDAGKRGKIREYLVYPRIGYLTFVSSGFKKTFPLAKNRPTQINGYKDLTVSAKKFGDALVQICNAEASALRNQGLSLEEIFGETRSYSHHVKIALHYDISLSTGTTSNGEGAEPIDVICQKDGSGTDKFVQMVEQADIEVGEMSTLGGDCKLNLSGSIISKEPNQQVKFRYKDLNGKASDLKTVQTGQNRQALFEHKYDLAGTGRKSGAIQIAIHGETTASNWGNYDVDCRKNSAGGLAGNGSQDDGDGNGVDDVAAGPQTFQLVLPDLMATPLGLSFAGSKRPWGSTAVITNPGHAAKTGVGPQKKHCRFEQVAFRPFNKGDAASGNFKMRVFRDSSLVEQQNFDLASHAGLPSNSGWHKFDLDLPQGRSTIKVALDTGKVVTESDETNNVYTVDVDVKFPCASGGTHLGTAAAGDDDDEGGGRKRKFGHRLENKGGIKQLKPMLTQ